MALSTFLPPETVDMLALVGPDFPDDLAFDVEMTILFSDMRGFTQLAEAHPPREVYAAINTSLAIQTRLVLKHQGSVNKFLGDGLLACFSGEQRVLHAIECVREMLRTLKKRDAEGVMLPSPVGFGINDGKVLLGLLGTEERREFTVIGDVVNTAARLCGIAKPFQALITDKALRALPVAMAEKHCRFYRQQQFKGKSMPIDVYCIKA
ncbi:MAG: adenylate/guanylate cyclase domain-containing protein [Mariprofundaceae bacterium]|nr:adenylate/guanylate cyclase domain-containing protein [Mariprofundaceae bacterium]